MKYNNGLMPYQAPHHSEAAFDSLVIVEWLFDSLVIAPTGAHENAMLMSLKAWYMFSTTNKGCYFSHSQDSWL